MAERTIELETPVVMDEAAEALRAATERAERAEAELARLKLHPQGGASQTPAHTAKTTHAPMHLPPAEEGSLFDGQEPKPDAASVQAKRKPATTDADDAVHTDALKQPPTPSTAQNAPEQDTAPVERGSADRAEGGSDGEVELRKDPMMAHLLDSLDAGTDVGHYGRLVFAMVARHFMPHAQVIAWLTKDRDFNAEQAQQMLHQVEGRDYNPPRRERLLQWQKEQEFQFMDVHDPDSGNLYRNLEFPKEVYDHIGHYQEAKAAE